MLSLIGAPVRLGLATLSSGFHPESIGKTERNNQEKVTHLCCKVPVNQSSWSPLIYLWLVWVHDSLPSIQTKVSCPSVLAFACQCWRAWFQDHCAATGILHWPIGNMFYLYLSLPSDQMVWLSSKDLFFLRHLLHCVLLIRVLPSLSTVWSMPVAKWKIYLVDILLIGWDLYRRKQMCNIYVQTQCLLPLITLMQWNTERFLSFFHALVLPASFTWCRRVIMLPLNYSCYQRHLSRSYGARVGFSVWVSACQVVCKQLFFLWDSSEADTISSLLLSSICCCRLATDFYAATNQSSIEGQQQPVVAARVS